MSDVASIRLLARHHRFMRGPRQLLDGERGVARIGIDAGPDGGRAEIDLAKQRRGLSQPGDVFLDRGKIGVELLAERHRHRVLKLRSPDLEDVARTRRPST